MANLSARIVIDLDLTVGETRPPHPIVAMKGNNMAKSSYKIGRSAKTGQFTTVKKATAKKSTHVVETIKRR
ncbi:MAG: hypothetical protein ABJQ71_19755 [Roseibium sp.]